MSRIELLEASRCAVIYNKVLVGSTSTRRGLEVDFAIWWRITPPTPKLTTTTTTNTTLRSQKQVEH